MEQLLKRNENENNELVANVFLGLLGLAVVVWVLTIVGVFEVYLNIASAFLIVWMILLLIPVILVKILKLRKPVMKYILVADSAVLVGVCYMFFSYQVQILFLVPVLIAMLYMNKKVLWFGEAVAFVAMAATTLLFIKYAAQPWIRINDNLDDVVRLELIPRIIQMVACFLIVNVLQSRVTSYFTEYDHFAKETRPTTDSSDSAGEAEMAEFEKLLTSLSESEANVFVKLLQGKTNTQIADELSFSRGTVKNYVSAIYDKLDCRERNYLILKYGAVAARYDQSHTKL
ncbi:regulatory protein, luxR family [Lachnospiraceae bacterium YSD2013]|nr:regulatory protein, luxR family [Lachnospiraceae bacterium YSD2013]